MCALGETGDGRHGPKAARTRRAWPERTLREKRLRGLAHLRKGRFTRERQAPITEGFARGLHEEMAYGLFVRIHRLTP